MRAATLKKELRQNRQLAEMLRGEALESSSLDVVSTLIRNANSELLKVVDKVEGFERVGLSSLKIKKIKPYVVEEILLEKSKQKALSKLINIAKSHGFKVEYIYERGNYKRMLGPLEISTVGVFFNIYLLDDCIGSYVADNEVADFLERTNLKPQSYSQMFSYVGEYLEKEAELQLAREENANLIEFVDSLFCYAEHILDLKLGVIGREPQLADTSDLPIEYAHYYEFNGVRYDIVTEDLNSLGAAIFTELAQKGYDLSPFKR